MTDKKQPHLTLQLAALALARTFMNTGLRMVYPFAPELARGLNVELSAIYQLVTIRNFAGFFSPLFGHLSERTGRRRVMILSLLLFVLGCGLVLVWPAYWPLGVTLALIAVAKVIFDPAMQAYVGDNVAYEKRGMAYAITEFSWAGALLIGAPLVGFLIQRQGWLSPFVWLAVGGIGSIFILGRLLPPTPKRTHAAPKLGTMLRTLSRYPVIWAAAAYSLLSMGANETFFIVYGDWMEAGFNLKLASLGLASGLIGSAEIVGELFAGWSVDRLGKRPVIITTGLLNALIYLLLPFTSGTLIGALASLFLLFLFFEITVVGAVPLLSELVPSARAATMAIVLASGALGRTLGDIIGPWVWEHGGLASSGTVAAVIMAAAVLVLAFWVREGTEPAAR